MFPKGSTISSFLIEVFAAELLAEGTFANGSNVSSLAGVFWLLDDEIFANGSNWSSVDGTLAFGVAFWVNLDSVFAGIVAANGSKVLSADG